MKKYLALLAFLLLFIAGSAFGASNQNYVEGEVLVVLRTGSFQSVHTSVATFPSIAAQTGSNIVHLRSATKTTQQLLDELKNDPRVKSASPNYIMSVSRVPDDPYYSAPASGDIKQWAPQMIGAPEVWDKTTGSTDVVVAVIDSGIDYRHPDLAANMARDSAGFPGRHFYSAYVWDPENGKVISTEPRMEADPDPVKAKTGVHGTHVAGIIGAVGNNATGIAGTSWRVGLLAVNIGTYVEEKNNKLEILWSNVIAGIDYVLSEKRSGMNVRVANISIGGWALPNNNSPLALAIKAMSDAGIILAISAGNEAQNMNSPGMGKFPEDKDTDYSELLSYPTCFRFDLTINVGAVGSGDEKAYYSNWGDEWVDIAAPGGNMKNSIEDPNARVLANGILSTIPMGSPSSMDIAGYASYQGTSMAAPYVAGAAALLMAAYPDETSAQIKDRILNGAKKIGISEGYWKHGRLDVAGAYNYVPPSSKGGGCNAGVFSLLAIVPIGFLFKRGMQKMKKYLALLAFLLLFIAGSAFGASNQNYVEGEVLVVLDTPSVQSVQSFASSAGLASIATFPSIAAQTGSSIVHLRSATKTTQQLLDELKNDPRVKSASPNYMMSVSRVPDDPYYSTPASGDIKQWAPQMIGAPEVWDKTTGSTDVVVAVIDTGIDYNHPDLAANMVTDSGGYHGRRFYSEYAWDVQNGKVISTEPRMDVDPHPVKAGTGEHGTHVAGIIGAVGNNETGIAGTSWRVGLLAVNVFTYVAEYNGPRTFNGDIIAGIDYILSQKRSGMNIRAANMSIYGWDSPQPNDSPYALAIKAMSDAGIIVAICAANDAQNLNSPGMGKFPDDKDKDYSGHLPYPACFRFDLTISVGAVGSGDEKAYYSNWGDKWVDIAAPGGNMRNYIGDPNRVPANGILSTIPTELPSEIGVTGYDSQQGTSMATPYVAGAAALLMAAYPDETSAQIKARLLNGAKKIGISEGYWKHGRLDVAGAYNYVPPSSNGGGCNAGVFSLFSVVSIVFLFKRGGRR